MATPFNPGSPMLLTALVLLQTFRDPIPLDFLSLEQANRLNGRRVTVTLLIDTPAYCDGERTIVGGADRPDEVTRGVILRGERYDVDEGEWITVTGTLRVISHGAAVVNGTVVPGWTEIRVEE
ncbi:MAG: hypothetical protein JWO38_3044 [Gemmataceae bacterium]|nr:hypothetical protein [Gemmataceae bacterium]